MNKGGFSMNKFLGISAMKTKVAKKTGIPTTKQGRKVKRNRIIAKTLGFK